MSSLISNRYEFLNINSRRTKSVEVEDIHGFSKIAQRQNGVKMNVLKKRTLLLDKFPCNFVPDFGIYSTVSNGRKNIVVKCIK